MVSVLAVGAAGPSAGLVVPQLAERGAHVRGLVRHEEQRAQVQARGAQEVVVGDLTDADQMRPALRGMDAAFYIAPAFIEHEADIGTAFVDAAVACGVRRIVFSSVIHPVLSALVNHAAKAPVEERILDSGLEYSFLHPALFFQMLGPRRDRRGGIPVGHLRARVRAAAQPARGGRRHRRGVGPPG